MPSPSRSTQLLPIALVLLAAISACKRDVPVPDGDVIAALALPTADDRAFDPESLRGKPTLVLFASPTCGYCMAELPIAERAALAEQANLVAVFIVGRKHHAASVTKSKGFKSTVLVDETGTLKKQYAIKGVPYTVVLGADGRARHAFRGQQDEGTLRAALLAAAR